MWEFQDDYIQIASHVNSAKRCLILFKILEVLINHIISSITSLSAHSESNRVCNYRTFQLLSEVLATTMQLITTKKMIIIHTNTEVGRTVRHEMGNETERFLLVDTLIKRPLTTSLQFPIWFHEHLRIAIAKWERA